MIASRLLLPRLHAHACSKNKFVSCFFQRHCVKLFSARGEQCATAQWRSVSMPCHQAGRITSVVITVQIATILFSFGAYLKKTISIPSLGGQKINRTQTTILHRAEESSRDNRTLVVLMGNLRGGEIAWSTLYENVLQSVGL